MIRTTLLVLAILLAAPSARAACNRDNLAECEAMCAEDGESCLAAGWLKYQANDAAGAVAYYNEACDKEEWRGCYALGQFHYNGAIGTKKDPVAARVPFEKACSAEIPKACSYVGLIYEKGDAAQKEKSNEFFVKACVLGVAAACVVAGDNFRVGTNTAKNPAKAAGMYEKGCLAPQDAALAACVQLSGMYLDGNGVQKDNEKAREVAEIACAAGHENGCKMRDYIDNPPKAAPAATAPATPSPSAAPVDKEDLLDDVFQNTSQLCASIDTYLNHQNDSSTTEHERRLDITMLDGRQCTAAVAKALAAGVPADTEIEFYHCTAPIASPMALGEIDARICKYGQRLGNQLASEHEAESKEVYAPYLKVLKGDKAKYFEKSDVLYVGTIYRTHGGKLLRTPQDFQQADVWYWVSRNHNVWPHQWTVEGWVFEGDQYQRFVTDTGVGEDPPAAAFK